MMRFLKTTAVAVALSVAGITLPATAQAGHASWQYHKPYYHKHFVHKPRVHVRHHRRGDALAAGIFGFAAGAIIAGALAQPRYHHPVPRYHVYHAPAPWTADWYAYCASKYRSFDPRSGLYLARSGVWRYCQ
jgi:hypothetical protein